MNDLESSCLSPSRPSLNRRGFLAGLGWTILPARHAFSYQANSRIRLGMIGCGQRGTFMAKLFVGHGGFELTAAADYFPSAVDTFGDMFKVGNDRRFNSLACHLRLLESGATDAVAIESPPYFHPGQAEAAVAAGRHVYLAKPVAVDIVGCRSITESAKRAAAKKLHFLVDFQTRANEFFQEALKKVHEGALGDLAFGESTYHAENPFADKYEFLERDPQDPENRLRAWGLDRELSGDIINEQNIHTLDVLSWIMNRPPLSAVGTGGLTARRKLGSCWDHFTVLFQYPEGVGVNFSSRQFKGHGTVPEGIRNRMFGSRGILETHYGGQVLIRGESFYRGGSTTDIYRQGAAANVAAFHRSILEGNTANGTVEPSVQSNLLSILGRTAAYRGEPLTWDQLMKTDEKWEARLAGLKS